MVHVNACMHCWTSRTQRNTTTTQRNKDSNEYIYYCGGIEGISIFFFLDFFLASKTATVYIGVLVYHIDVLRGTQAFFRFYRYPTLATMAIALQGLMWFFGGPEPRGDAWLWGLGPSRTLFHTQGRRSVQDFQKPPRRKTKSNVSSVITNPKNWQQRIRRESARCRHAAEDCRAGCHY